MAAFCFIAEDEDDDDDDDGLSGGEIAGIVIAVIIVVILLIVVLILLFVYFYLRKKGRRGSLTHTTHFLCKAFPVLNYVAVFNWCCAPFYQSVCCVESVSSCLGWKTRSVGFLYVLLS